MTAPKGLWMASEAYGELQKVYHADPIKLLTNFLVGLFLLGMGVVTVIAALDQQRESLVLVGGLAGIGGLTILLRTIIFNFGHEVRLYENGVELRWFRHSQRWFFDQITGIQVTAISTRQMQTMHAYLLRDYTFYDDRVELFRIDPVYFNWHRLGERLAHMVAQTHNRRDITQIKNGFEIVFDELIPVPHFDKYIPLKVNLFGIVEEGKPLLPWPEFGGCIEDPQDRGKIVITNNTGQVYSRFPYYNTINSIRAVLLIRAAAQLRGNK
jgi:hypothetical protein